MHLFLAPHLDDAIYSCGATIRRLTANGQSVRVLTITAGDPPSPLPDSPLVRELHQRWGAGHNPIAARRTEDRVACQIVGAEAQHLPLVDCIYRVSASGAVLYPREDALFGDVHEDDPLPAALDAVPLPDTDDLTLYVPLGAGQHVDHQIVRDWGIRLLDQHPRWVPRFYEEYPYIERDANAAEHALDYLMTWHPELQLEMQVFWVSEQEVAAKCDAVAAYASQISSFWENDPAMRQSVRATMLRSGATVLAERFYGRIV